MLEAKGKVIAVRGPIVDVFFDDSERMPAIYEIIKAKSVDGSEILLEVMEQLKGGIERCVCLTLNIGLRRNSEAVATGSVITMPDSSGCYGRLLNAFGKPLDNKGPV